MTLSHIVCPVDLSACSRRALEYAFAWARRHEAAVHVVHVVAVPVPLVEVVSVQMGVPPGGNRALLREELDQFVAAVPHPGIRTVVEIAEGRPAEVIHEIASRHPYSAIVLGTHGRTGLLRRLLGSVAEQVTHGTPCPVLLVPPHAGDAPASGEFRHVVCGVDLQPSSLAALRYGLALAQETHGILDIVHVVRPAGGELVPDSLIAPIADRPATRLDYLRGLVSAEERSECSVREHTYTGYVMEELLRHTDVEHGDLLVMGTGEHHRLFGHALEGHTAAYMASQAPCPILIVPGPALWSTRRARAFARESWAEELDRLTAQYRGLPARVSIMSDVAAPQREASDLPLVGLTVEPRQDAAQVVVTLGRADGTHLTHFISEPVDIRLGEAPDEQAFQLLIEAVDGSTTVVCGGAAEAGAVSANRANATADR